MIRIAIIIPTVNQIGGAERQVLLLAAALVQRGHSVTLITLGSTEQHHVSELAKAGVAVLSLNMRKAWIDPRGWHRYIAWARKNPPHIVHAHLPHATWFARCVRLLCPIRALIDTIHTTQIGGAGRQAAYRLTDWLSNQLTAVSIATANSVLSANLTTRDKLILIPNGVELRPPTGFPRRASKKWHPFRWIAVGRLVPLKDYPTLFRAFAQLPTRPTLTVAGTGPEEAALRALANALGIEERVLFTGFQSDLLPLLQTSDAFVLASRWEGLPVSVLEASAAHLPVVATDGPGTCETIRPGESGFLVPIQDVAALASAMEAVMALTPKQRLTMGEHGRQFVEERFSVTSITAQWENLYTALLKERPRPSRSGTT
jgi:glycosyltransferase involved in cell wall biosynthesis